MHMTTINYICVITINSIRVTTISYVCDYLSVTYVWPLSITYVWPLSVMYVTTVNYIRETTIYYLYVTTINCIRVTTVSYIVWPLSVTHTYDSISYICVTTINDVTKYTIMCDCYELHTCERYQLIDWRSLSWADSLRSHVILDEWPAFYSAFFKIIFYIHLSGVLKRWHGWYHTKLLPSRRKFCVHHTTILHITSCKATYVRCMRV